MLISVFTPSHDPRYLDACFESLQRQTIDEWEWIVLLNGTASDWAPPTPDERVRVERSHVAARVGAAKRAACAACTGDVLFELDHDDVLTPTCLEEVRDAFQRHPDVVLVYSDFAQIGECGEPNGDRFNDAMGWEYTEEVIGVAVHLRCGALAALPHNIGYIWYAPNHLRAFRSDAYAAAGGYDAELAVLDDQDLLIRLFQLGDFHHIDRCLYLQRVHAGNTQSDPETNAFIQAETVRYYQDNIDALASAWSTRRGLATVSLRAPTCPTRDDALDMVTIDPTEPMLPFADDSVGVIRAPDVLQRLPDRAAFLNECHRVLAHGGVLLTLTPSTDGRGAWQDPSHLAFYNENSFWYLTNERYHSSVPTLTARFQIGHVRTYFPTEWDREVDIPYVQAHLLAVKDGPRMGGPLLC